MLTDKDITYLQNSPKRMKQAASMKYFILIFLLLELAMGFLYLFACYKAACASNMSLGEVVDTLSIPDSEKQYPAVHLFLAQKIMMGLWILFGLCPLSFVILLAIVSAQRDYRIYRLLQSKGLIEQAGSIGPRSRSATDPPR